MYSEASGIRGYRIVSPPDGLPEKADSDANVQVHKESSRYFTQAGAPPAASRRVGSASLLSGKEVT